MMIPPGRSLLGARSTCVGEVDVILIDCLHDKTVVTLSKCPQARPNQFVWFMLVHEQQQVVMPAFRIHVRVIYLSTLLVVIYRSIATKSNRTADGPTNKWCHT